MDETTTLLDDSPTANRHRPLVKLAATYRQTPRVESGATSSEQASRFEYGAISNLKARCEDHSPPINFQQATDDEVPLEEVVQALCSAWQRKAKPKAEITLDFFTTQELYEMHLAWRKVTSGKHCNAEAHRIAEALADKMATAMTPKSPFPSEHLSFISWNLAFHADKNLLAVNLLREWKRITEGDDHDNFAVLDDSDYQPLVESERVLGFWQRQAQLCDAIRPLILHFRFQILLHSLLISWPISILIVATKYMECTISHRLLYLLMILGGIGCLAVAIRVMLILLTRRSRDSEALSWGWTGLRLIEFDFLIVFIIQAYHFFDTTPPSEPEPDQCAGDFYGASLRMNWVSIVLLSAYLLVYFEKICLNWFQASH
ncbi:hypothetical protein AVEN_142907-2 [Araneus ventricosus]|uniref:Transmembrane protein n=1 Tax=Araneus ventricosus TaxID=182803 RepID=A0A4Y2FL20_ARAVE|nr:hypothetical protein AVEN_142907-1 [Araneus ventricosus]GBM41932.1 hypothetical protein AVEN_142907-2 [Araneus ventricosus]